MFAYLTLAACLLAALVGISGRVCEYFILEVLRLQCISEVPLYAQRLNLASQGPRAGEDSAYKAPYVSA